MKPINAIYWFNSFNLLAWALIGIFIPIYLITLGYSLQQIFYFYVLDSLVVFFSSVTATLIAARIGLKKTLLIYLPLLAVFIVLLYSANYTAVPLWLVAIFSALQTSFYFMPFNIMFARAAREEKMGESVGRLYSYSQLACMAAPLFGGLAAIAGGFPVLILISGSIFFAASFLLFFIPDDQAVIEFDFCKAAAMFKKHARYAFIQIFYFFQKTLEDVIWPVFIYLAFGSIFSVGMVGALIGLGGCLFMVLVGRRADAGGKKKLFKIGGLFLAAVWLLRFFIKGEFNYYILSVCAGFFGILASVPFEAYTFNKSKKENTAEFMIFRESLLLASRLLAFGLVAVLVSRLDYAFIVAAISSLLFVLF